MLKSKPDFEIAFAANSSTEMKSYNPTPWPTVGRQTQVTQAQPVLMLDLSSLKLVVGHS